MLDEATAYGQGAGRTHFLKTWPVFFSEVWSGAKPFELRKNDRDYKVGDWLHLEDWAPGTGYTGRAVIARVSYVLADVPDFGLMPGYAILGLVDRQNKEVR